MGGNHQADLGSGRRQGNALAIVERTHHPTFRMRAYLIGERASACLTTGSSSRQSSRRAAQSRLRPGVRTSMSGAASRIVAIQAQQHRNSGKRKLCP